ALAWHLGASPDKISVIPCGVNLDLFRPVDKATARRRLGFGDNKLILFVGRIEPLKGIDQLIRAIGYLADDLQPRLVIIGGGEDSQDEIARLRQLAENLNIADSVTFLGLIEQERLPLFYSAADVCVNPSYYETFGLVALESLACGTPVVATDVGGFRDVICSGETGYVLPDNSPCQMADKIAAAISEPDADSRNALSIRASVSQYSWSNIARAFAGQCSEVLDNYLAPAG
ncbi:MAG: glycosyltransferase, partial [Chloroflexi bacterium]|nr:glycosyltransferase [Chloroflexota bacterium]